MNSTNKLIIVAIIALIIGIGIGTLLPRTDEFRRGGPMMRNDRGMMMANIDQRFIEEMIPHHEGAIAMAEVALQKSKRPEIQSLANGIIEAQTRENNDMRTWYQEWFGQTPPEGGSMGHSMGGMGGMHMQGMEGDLDALEIAADFDQEFLAQMIVHHEMAIMMARMLDAGTERPEMKQLADNIITSQSREIDTMRSWAREWQNQGGSAVENGSAGE